MAIDFPSSPTTGQQYVFAGVTYTFTAQGTWAAAISGAPVNAEYVTSTADATLTAERVLTDTATVTWDRTTAGQIKANGADVFKASSNTFTAQNFFTNFGVVIGNTVPVTGSRSLEIHTSGIGGDGVIQQAKWLNGSAGVVHYFDKSRGAAVGTHTVVQASDILGSLVFEGSDGTAFRQAARIEATVNGAPSGSVVPGSFQIYATNAAGTAVQVAGLSPSACNLWGQTNPADNAPTGYVGEYVFTQNFPNSALVAGAYNACNSISVPPGDWDLEGTLHVNVGTVHTTVYAVLNTSVAGTNNSLQTVSTNISAAFSEAYMRVGPLRISTASTVTYYLVCYPQNTCNLADSSLQLRRRH